MALNTQDSTKITTVDILGEWLHDLRLPITKRRNSYDDVRYIRKSTIDTIYRGTPEEKRITQLLCDSALLEPELGGRKFDFIFVDASHSYEYTRNDTDIALRHIASGGIILWHDYGKSCWPGVKRALDELYANDNRLRRIERTSFVMLQNYSTGNK